MYRLLKPLSFMDDAPPPTDLKPVPPAESPAPPLPKDRAKGWADRLKAAGIHLGLSIVVALLAAALVFGLWYPMPFREISGGRELFLLIVAVDVVIGPVITLAVFDRRKPSAELRRDLAVVALLQLAALAYGLHTVFEARPVVLALEGDRRLRVVRAIDLPPRELAKAPAGLRELPLWGQRIVATRPPKPDEVFEAVQLGMAGVDLGMRPEFWLPESAAADAIRRAARPLDTLRARFPGRVAELDQFLRATGKPAAQLRYLPLLSRRTDFVALIDAESGQMVGSAPFDGF